MEEYENIADIKSNIHSIEEAIAMVEEANRTKSAFLANMSHDIRTPMNAIINFAQLAISQPEISPKTHEYLENILLSSNRLLSLVNSVLEMSKIDKGLPQINLISCNICELIVELKNYAIANMGDKHQTFTTDVSGIKHENIICDSLRINLIMMNLVNNAIKYTESGGEISVTAWEEDSYNPCEGIYHFVIKDTGVGIDEDFIDKIFMPFERETSSTINEVHGTGLGLAISKNLIEKMRGSISVKSTKGIGSEFFVDIPFSFDVDNESLSPDNLINNDRASVADVDWENIKILLVEDSMVNRLIVKELFKDIFDGVYIDEAADGKQALDMILSKEPGYYSVILMDIQMPIMNGLDATRAIREMSDENADTPIIALTANVFDEDRSNAFEAGVDGFVPKPIDMDMLVREISSAIAKKRQS